VLKGTASIPGREILYVDSASEDGTIGIASRHRIEYRPVEEGMAALSGRRTVYNSDSGSPADGTFFFL